jgi:hypothetical protein
MQSTELTINPELRDLLPPLSPEEFSGLETEILRDGCTDKLTLWGNILVDGHHRYTICTKHGLPFKTKQKPFQSVDDAKLCMWQHQENRRNWSIFQRAEVTLKLKDVVATQAKSRQRGGQGGILLCQNSDKAKKIDTKKELAQRGKVSHDTLNRVEYILEHADEEVKEKLRRGEKETSINREYKRLKAEMEAKESPKPRKPRKTKTVNVDSKSPTSNRTPDEPVQPKQNPVTKSTELFTSGDETVKAIPVALKGGSKVKDTYCCGVVFEPDPGDTEYDWLTEEQKKEFAEVKRNCVNPIFPQIHNFTIQNIPEHKPDYLIGCLYALFKVRYREKLVYELLRKMYQDDGEEKELARTIVTTLYHEFTQQS